MMRKRPNPLLAEDEAVGHMHRDMSSTEGSTPKEVMARLTREINKEIADKLSSLGKSRAISNRYNA